MPAKPDYGILREILDTENGPFASVFQHPEKYNLQIVYTQIDRDRNNRPSFRDHVFMTEPGSWPCSGCGS